MEKQEPNGLLIYTSKIKGVEIYIRADHATIRSIKDITEAYIVDGQVFISLANKMNFTFDENIISSITQNTEDEIVVTLSNRSIDLDTMGTISRYMPKDYILTSIHINIIDSDTWEGGYSDELCLIYRKAN